MAATINKYDPLFPGFFPLFFPLFLSLFLSFSPQKIFLLLLLLIIIIIIPVSSCSSGSLLPVFGSLFVPIARRLAHCVAMKDRRGGTPPVFTIAVARWRWRRRVMPSCPVGPVSARPITNPSGLDRSTHRRTRASGRLVLSPGLICISGRRFPANQKTGTETEWTLSNINSFKYKVVG